jgi:hypothetical protein
MAGAQAALARHLLASGADESPGFADEGLRAALRLRARR